MPSESVTDSLASGALIIFNASCLYETVGTSEGLKPLSLLYTQKGTWREALEYGFRVALKRNYDTVFLYALRVLDCLSSNSSVETALAELVEAAQHVGAKSGLLRNDLSGRVYHSALGRRVAKAYATYYTSIPAAELLAWLSIEKSNAVAADFASGSGTLLVASYHRKLALAFAQESDGINVTKLHKRFVQKEIWGFDAMPFASHLTMVNLALQQPTVRFRKSKVYHVPCGGKRMGSLDLLESETIAVQQRMNGGRAVGPVEHRVTGQSKRVDVKVPRSSFDLIIMNPPFSRNDRASKVLDGKLLRRALERRNMHFSEAGLAAPFVVLCDLQLAPGGRLAVVLPSAAAARESWQPVRELLSRNYDVEYVIVNWAPGRSAFSEEVSFREILLVARRIPEGNGTKVRRGPGKDTLLVHIDEPLTLISARATADAMRQFAKNPEPFGLTHRGEQAVLLGIKPVGAAVSVSSRLLALSVDNWYRLIAFRDQELVRLALNLEGLISLPYAPFGIRMADRLRSLSEIASPLLYAKNTESAGYRTLSSPPQDGGIPYVRDADLARMRISDSDLLWLKQDPSLTVTEKFTPPTGNLLVARKTNVNATMRVGSALVEGKEAAGSMWFPVKTRTLRAKDNREITPGEVAKILTMWFNSSFGLLLLIAEREEIEGAYMEWKTERIRSIRALDPRTLDRGEVDNLVGSWDSLAALDWKLLKEQFDEAIQSPDQSPRRRLDELIAKTVGIQDPLAFDELYAKLRQEINRLAAVMRGGGRRGKSESLDGEEQSTLD